MKAAVVHRLPTRTVEVGDVPSPELAEPDDVLVRVSCCGVCGTDLHILDGHSYRMPLPFVLGHEPVGVVAEIGSAVDRRWLGRRVTVTLFDGDGGRCALCREEAVAGPCQSGDERLCPQLRSVTGIQGAWGAFAEVVRVKARHLVEVPDALTDHQAATLVDGGATAFNAARRALEHEPRWPVVVGGGAVGMLVAEALEAAGRPAVVVEPSEIRRRALASLGHRVVADPAAVEQPVDCVVECSGSPAGPPWAVGRLAPRGVLVLAGYAVVPEMDFAPVARKELRIAGVRSGARRDLERVLEQAAAGRVRVPAVTRWPLGQINGALEALRLGEVPGKAVIDA